MEFTSKQEVELMLKEALELEKTAQLNCEAAMEILKKNGYYKEVESIRNDELDHQGIVNELITLLK